MVLAVVGIGSPLAAQAQSRGTTTPVAMDTLPLAARTTIEQQAGKHRITSLSEHTKPNGAPSYEAKFKTLTEGQVAVDVASDGSVLGRYRKLEEPVGDGP